MRTKEPELDRAEMLDKLMESGFVWMYDDEESGEIAFEVNCNDLWALASADSEKIPYDEIENCYKLGPLTWACVRRGIRPMKGYEEDMKFTGAWSDHLEALPVREGE